MEKRWPHWPEDQLMLIDLGRDVPVTERQDPADTSRMPQDRRKDPMKGKTTCKHCGAVKTIGLPCPCQEGK
jgi:hypothetical protein